MADTATAARTPKPEPDWELVLKRNPVERIKQEKDPLGIRDELPALIAAGLRGGAGGGHRPPPVVGPLPRQAEDRALHAADQAAERAPAAGEAARDRRGLASGTAAATRELATRQNVQLHWLELATLPDVFADLDAAGLSTAGGCGDTVRNITGCPVQGLAHDELFDATGVVEEAADFFYGNPDYSDLPRKHKITISACAHQCNAPEINCIALVGAVARRARGLHRPRRRRALLGAAHLRATWASSSRGRTRSRCCGRSSTSGRPTCATASRA